MALPIGTPTVAADFQARNVVAYDATTGVELANSGDLGHGQAYDVRWSADGATIYATHTNGVSMLDADAVFQSFVQSFMTSPTEQSPYHIAVDNAGLCYIMVSETLVSDPEYHVVRITSSDLSTVLGEADPFTGLGVLGTAVIEVNGAGTILYHAYPTAGANVGKDVVHQWDLVNAVPLADLGTFAGQSVEWIRRAVTGTDVFVFTNTNTAGVLSSGHLHRVQADGTVVFSYVLNSQGANNLSYVFAPDPDGITGWYTSNPEVFNPTNLTRILLADNSLVTTFHDGSSTNPYGRALAFAPATGSLVVTKVVDSTVDTVTRPFQFTAGGGLSPTTFSLMDGESRTFANLAAGSGLGYSIEETLVPGFVTTYDVSNGSSYLDITVPSSGTVTVTVTNRDRREESVIRRVRIAPHITEEQQRMTCDMVQLDMQPGIGNVVPPGHNPVVMFSQSVDGGNTWLPERLMYVGEIGQYLTRTFLMQFGQARDRVFKAVVSDPVVSWAIAAAYGKFRKNSS